MVNHSLSMSKDEMSNDYQHNRRQRRTVTARPSNESESVAEHAEEIRPPRYIVGIDSGTTNHAVSFIDTESDPQLLQVFAVEQLTAAGQTELRETLPSFVFSREDTADSADFRLPWQSLSDQPIVGFLARDLAAVQPGRAVESAKSWLCHPGVDRRASILPWHAEEGAVRMSPVEGIAACLRQIRESWDYRHPAAPLAEQDVVITIPASFDEVARELTVAAARKAGIPRLTLLEEPQAAFYAWIHQHRESWEQLVLPGQNILVCDIGGGTTDFSLIQVRANGDQVEFHRVAVGDHLLLGGDNLDLAIAHHAEALLSPDQPLEPSRWSRLISESRAAKEKLLGPDSPSSCSLAVGGTGSRFIGGTLQITLDRETIVQLVVDGFLPQVRLGEIPQQAQSGFQEFGLPFAADPSISRHLCSFLTTRSDAEPIAPDLVLFNGGFFESQLLQDRVLAVLQDLFAESSPGFQPQVLTNTRLDLAVAQGAAAFGLVRRGQGTRIVAGLARSYYIGVCQGDGAAAAVCLVSAGSESDGTVQTLEQKFRVRTAEPVEFPVYTSATRLTDSPGDLVPPDPEQLTALPPVRTMLTTRKQQQGLVEATLSAQLTEIGTLQLWCEQLDGEKRWQLQFDVRSAVDTQRVVHMGTAEQSGIVDDEQIALAGSVLQRVFTGSGENPDRCMKLLAESLGLARESWPPSLLRSMWLTLMDLSDSCRISAQHEARWLNLAGYCLRPGFGMAADDWRVEELWKVMRGRTQHQHPACLAEFRTLCRRISGGLSAGRQNQIARKIMPAIRQKVRQVQSGRGKGGNYASGNHEAAEIWRMLGSFELLESALRRELGEMAADLSSRKSFTAIHRALIWTVGRAGSRVPVYGPLNSVLPAAISEDWISRLLKEQDLQDSTTQYALMQLARKTGDRYRDISESLRRRTADLLTQAAAADDLVGLIRQGGTLSQEDTEVLLGESLPWGLQLS